MARLSFQVNSKFNQIYKGFKIFEFIKPNIKKINEIITDQILTITLISGYNKKNKKTTKKTIPKLRLEPIFTSFMEIIYICVNSTWQQKVLTKFQILLLIFQTLILPLHLNPKKVVTVTMLVYFWLQ